MKMQISKPSILQSILLLLIPVLIASFFLKTSQNHKQQSSVTMNDNDNGAASASVTVIHGVKIDRNPTQSMLDQLDVTSWPKWSGQPGKMPWTFEGEETMYLLEGKVKVSVDGHEGSFEIEAGNLAVFPKGMKITWDVLEAVNKHYNFKK